MKIKEKWGKSVQLVHLAYQEDQWLLWLEGEPSEEDDKVTPFGGSEKELEEFWSRFWQSEEDAETTESLFWPSPNLKKYNFYLPSIQGEPVQSEFFLCSINQDKVTRTPFSVMALAISSQEAQAICKAASEQARLVTGFRAAPELCAWNQLFEFSSQLALGGSYLPSLEKNEKKEWASSWLPMPSMGEQEWLIKWSQQAPGVILAGFSGSRYELAQKVIQKELNRILRHEAAERINEEKQRQEEGMEKFSPYLQKMIADGTLSVGREKANRKENLHDQWLRSLKSPDSELPFSMIEGERLFEEISQWQERFLHWRSAPLRLALSLSEPVEKGIWPVTYWLQSAADSDKRISLAQLWKGKKEPKLEGVNWEGSLREWVLTTLGAGSLISPKINFSLRTSSPEGFNLNTSEIVTFLEKETPQLLENGFIFLLPEGWQGSRKLTLKAQGKLQQIQGGPGHSKNFNLSWNLSLDGEPLTQQEIQSLLVSEDELIEFRGRWVQVDQGEVQKLLTQWKKQSEKTLSLGEALQMSLAGEFSEGPMLDSLEMDDSLTEWTQAIIQRKFEELPVPESLQGVLRPYQIRGFSWLAFLAEFGLGSCLADDMGLGKTIQAIAFLAHLKKSMPEKPFLLVCPTSLLGNWYRELEKFWPESIVYIHHGTARKPEEFKNAVEQGAVILTTYSLLSRDEELICSVSWGAAVLDEAQNIKNPLTRQAQASRHIQAYARVALTGTPVENHAGDLWSILQFLNPGILPSWGRFQREFLRPIQEEQNEEQLERLRNIASPFLLRRLKSDPTIAPDLPDKEVLKVICSLGAKQAQLYRKILAEAEQGLAEAKGMSRRGLILATLTKLKQVCAHPSLVDDSWAAKRAESGKLERLEEMIDEIVENGGKSLVFTQFIDMGKKLRSTLADRLGKPVLFYHGGLTRTDRDALIERFQTEENIPVLILSLRAGGTGLNLTAASHVFHYDRWWNPAVEDQATDRAHRIGQLKDVQVVHLICGGTLEERISELIERKRSVAIGLVESGETWLTELSGQELSQLWNLDEDKGDVI